MLAKEGAMVKTLMPTAASRAGESLCQRPAGQRRAPSPKSTGSLSRPEPQGPTGEERWAPASQPLAAPGSQGSGSGRPQRTPRTRGTPRPRGRPGAEHSLEVHTEDTFLSEVTPLCSTWQVNTLWLSQALSVMVSELSTL